MHAGIRLLIGSPPSGAQPQQFIRPWVAKSAALLCAEADCEAIFPADGTGSCPACGSRVSWPLAKLVDRPPVEEVPYAPAS